MPYDLLIKNGHVFDPGQSLDGVMDIAITDGKIAAVAPNLPVEEAKQHIVVRGDGRYITPGLIDMHAHVAFGLQTQGVNWQAANPELIGVQSGVTTIVDGGTCGAYNFGIVPTWVVPNTRTRTIYYLSVGSYGLVTQSLPKARSDIQSPADIDLEATFACVEAHRDLIKGIKLRLLDKAVETMGRQLVDLALEAARGLNVPLMTHIGDFMGESPEAPALTDYLISRMQPHDIITHVCTSHSGGLLDADGRVKPAAVEAQKAGVVMDPAGGRRNYSQEVARIEADQGFYADTISTDMSAPGRSFPIYSLTEAMSRFMATGYSLEQVVRMTTANPAKALRMENEIGAIAVGRVADLTILDDVTGKWRFIDTNGATFTGEHALVPVQTLRAGKLISPDWGPHAWGWLPEAVE
jgi:dihydroorotase